MVSGLLCVVALSSSAWSTASTARVKDESCGSERVKLYRAADSASSVLESLQPGDLLEVAGSSREGFYKVRAPGQKIGFVEQVKTLWDEAPSSASFELSPSRKSLLPGVLQLEPAGGLQLLNMPDLLAVTQINESVYFALSGAFAPNDSFANGLFSKGLLARGMFAAALRVERIGQTASLTDDNTGYIYDPSLSSIPLSLGLQAQRRMKQFSLRGGLFFTTALHSSATLPGRGDKTTAA